MTALQGTLVAGAVIAWEVAGRCEEHRDGEREIRIGIQSVKSRIGRTAPEPRPTGARPASAVHARDSLSLGADFDRIPCGGAQSTEWKVTMA